jgi:hypothetical protein
MAAVDYSAAMRWLALVVLAACGGGGGSEVADAPPRDGVESDAVEQPVDAPAIDAPPDGPFSTASPACTTAPAPLLDVSPRQIANIAIAGNTLYVAVFRVVNGAAAETAVLSIDATTGAEVAPPLQTGGSPAVWSAGGDVYAADGHATDGAIWRLHPGQAPVRVATSLRRPFAVAADASHLYWTELPPGGGDELVVRRELAGTAVEVLMTCSSGMALRLSDDDVYCAALLDGVRRAPKTGGGGVGVVDATGYPITSIVREGDMLYAVNMFNNPQVLRGPLPDGPLAVVDELPILGRYLGLALTDAYYYTSEVDTGIRRIHRTTGVRELIAPTLGAAANPIVQDGRLFYIATTITTTTSGSPYVMHCVD